MTEVHKVPVEVSADQTQAWVHFDQLSYDDFGRSNNISHWKVTKIIEAGWEFATRAGIFDHPTIVSNHFGAFEICVEYSCTDALWKVLVGTQFPYIVSLELEGVGKTSATFFCRLVNKLDYKTLVTFRSKMVRVDLTTHKPAPLPQWILKKYKGVSRPGSQPLILPKTAPKVPDSAFDYRVTVAACHLDSNAHANQSAYFRYCCDAAQAALKNGRLTAFLPDISRFPLRETTAVFAGETSLGDSLLVSLWQQNGRPDIVQYVIRKEDVGQPIVFHASMTYGLIQVTSTRL